MGFIFFFKLSRILSESNYTILLHTTSFILAFPASYSLIARYKLSYVIVSVFFYSSYFSKANASTSFGPFFAVRALLGSPLADG
jgi:hypothetical protein